MSIRDWGRYVAFVAITLTLIFLVIDSGLGVWSLYEANRQAYREYQHETKREQQEAAEKIANKCGKTIAPFYFGRECLLREFNAYQHRENTNQDLQAQQERLIPLTQVRLYVVGVVHRIGLRFCGDCLA
jgi:hypothetical protein